MARIPSKPGVPNLPNKPGVPKPPDKAGLSRKEKAEQLKAEIEAKKKEATKSAGAEWHRVQKGETLDAIAAQYGVSADEIWNHNLNKQLRDRRKTPDAIAPGDALYIPSPKKPKETQPTGQGEHVVKEGDCVSSIAKDSGHFWETIWNHPENSQLKEARKDPNILLPKDKVTVPPITQKWEPGETEMRHRFVRRGEPSFLRLTVMDDEKPLATKPYKLIVDNHTHEGKTDSEGRIDAPIPGNAKKAKLIVGNEDEDDCFKWDLDLGHVDPVKCDDGVKKRLTNLGFDPPVGKRGGSEEEKYRQRLKEYQKTYELEETGEADEETQDCLKEKHRS